MPVFFSESRNTVFKTYFFQMDIDTVLKLLNITTKMIAINQDSILNFSVRNFRTKSGKITVLNKIEYGIRIALSGYKPFRNLISVNITHCSLKTWLIYKYKLKKVQTVAHFLLLFIQTKDVSLFSISSSVYYFSSDLSFQTR
jgi:hypothetical protein